MLKLDPIDYKKIAHLVSSQNELSVFSVINGIMPGEIYVNNIDTPTSALIQTCECNLFIGNANDVIFNSEIINELDFWDQVTPDTREWADKIPSIHENKLISKYERRHYALSINQYVEQDINLMDGYFLEKVDPIFLRGNTYENSEKLLEWVQNWGNDETFLKYGTGYYIRNDEVIVSWSLSDCCFDDKIAIGIHTDDKYRKSGFGRIVVDATIKDCFKKGYKTVEWLCVDSNKGSIAIAEKFGFTLINYYDSFSSYPPIENFKDLSENEWYEWGEYLENASTSEERLLWDCLYSYIKSNHVEKTIEMIESMQKKININYCDINNFINMLQFAGMCSNFNGELWLDYIKQ